MNQELKKFSAGLAEAVKSAGAFTVAVRSRRRLPATGIALDAETILTAAHVIEDDENIQVVLPDGTQVAAELLGYDPNSDLAALKLETASATPAATEESVQVGELVLALGRPFGDVQASLGTLSAKSGPVQYRSGGMLEGHYRTDATPYPGFSGGPLINVEGQVVGINTSGLGIGNSVAIPIGVAAKVAAMLKEHGTIKRGYLGISSQPVELPGAAQEALGRDQESGLLVVDLEEDGPAAGGGMMVGDILVGLGGEAVETHRQLMVQLSGDVVDREIDLEVLRGGKPETLKITIGTRPDFHAEGRARHRARFARHWGVHHRSRHHWPRGRHGRRDKHDHGSEDE
jgi:S1-C subfamily serine protease